ncbi:MAG: aminomethyl-transferring glycine dehydrogenase subunit GcvPA [Nitrososphaerales archaeon]
MTVHKFLPNSEEKIVEFMLQKLGHRDISELFSDIPESVRLNRPLRLPESMSEIELEKFVNSKLAKNKTAPDFLNFIGGGNWLHHVPSIIDEILSRGEFYTAYTPYQPEISQGMLQGLFEYQSQMCNLVDMQVANSSLYDWGTALGEAGRMAERVTRRRRVLVCKNTSPERVGVLKTYTYPAGIDVVGIGYDEKSGKLDLASLDSKLNQDTAALYIENPNFLGIIEDQVDEMEAKCHSRGALLIVGVNPISLGLLKPPGSYGADIVVGDGQPLGIYPNFGGPLMGIFATRNDPRLLRQMPGRLIGMTRSKDGKKRGFTMVLQTREQHIRRENATSNICTNEALFALAVSIYLSTMGPQGMREVGEQIVANSHYALRRFQEESFSAPQFEGAFFGDVSLKTGNLSSTELTRRLIDYGILGGLPLGRFYPDLKNISLFSFNETHSEAEIESLVTALSMIVGAE